MVELELSLYNCKQDIQIQKVNLDFHVAVAEAGKKVQTKGGLLRVEDLGELSQSAEVLNAVQAGVNNWIKNIQQVTRIDRWIAVSIIIIHPFLCNVVRLKFLITTFRIDFILQSGEDARRW
jgi:hypothetical protein